MATIGAAQMQNLDVSKPAVDASTAAGGGGRSLPVHEAALQHVNLYKDKFKTGAVDRYAVHDIPMDLCLALRFRWSSHTMRTVHRAFLGVGW